MTLKLPKDIATPAYILDEAPLKKNMATAARIKRETGCKILLATKAFSLPAAFPLMRDTLDGTTASGEYEARMGHEEFGKEVHVYSPAYIPGEVENLAKIAKHIYFNSDRTGLMQIWRMNTDGSEQTQLFNDEYNNWFPHPSPDGKTVVFLSYDKSVKGHPENKDVMLRRLNLATNKIDVLAKLFGGQGTINVPCFSPDGRRIAFMTYQWIP